jgi:hypothetical protein
MRQTHHSAVAVDNLGAGQRSLTNLIRVIASRRQYSESGHGLQIPSDLIAARSPPAIRKFSAACYWDKIDMQVVFEIHRNNQGVQMRRSQ